MLKYQVTGSITRGIASGSSYGDIAKTITKSMVGDYSKMSGGALGKAMQITRTESHRIKNEASYHAALKAKENGADIVKQWDSALDSRTRPHHAQLDGQIRELDEPFEVAGHKALYPGSFGVASEDIQCRCVALTRARWALDDEELETLKERAEYFGLDKTKDFKVALLSEKAVDVDYLSYKLENKLKDEKKTLELDENDNIKDWNNIISGLKTQFPTQFEGSTSKKIDEHKLENSDGNHALTRNEILKMPYAERAKLYSENPKAYGEAMKN